MALPPQVDPPSDQGACSENFDTPPAVRIPAERWEEFRDWLERPIEVNPGLAELLRLTPTWER